MKLLIREEGTDAMQSVWMEPVCVTSCLTYPEACAVLATAVRRRRLAVAGGEAARRRLDRLWEEIAAVSLDEGLAAMAGSLAAVHGLCGADAVHLATALAVAGDDLVFATWDERLAAAAEAAGLVVIA